MIDERRMRMAREKSENDETRDDTRDVSLYEKTIERGERRISPSRVEAREEDKERERKKARGEEDKTHAHDEQNEHENVCA